MASSSGGCTAAGRSGRARTRWRRAALRKSSAPARATRLASREPTCDGQSGGGRRRACTGGRCAVGLYIVCGFRSACVTALFRCSAAIEKRRERHDIGDPTEDASEQGESNKSPVGPLPAALVAGREAEVGEDNLHMGGKRAAVGVCSLRYETMTGWVGPHRGVRAEGPLPGLRGLEMRRVCKGSATVRLHSPSAKGQEQLRVGSGGVTPSPRDKRESVSCGRS